MLFRYQTDRLILMVGESDLAPLVNDYLVRNRDDFELYERNYPDNYYTIQYQEMALEGEQKLLLRSAGVRFYMFLKDRPDFVIGNVSFSYLTEDFGHRCTLGYRVDRDYRNRGYAYEATSFLIREVSREYNLHRIEADILPENEASLALIKKLGFEYEGIARSAHEIGGKDRDHLRWSLVFSHPHSTTASH